MKLKELINDVPNKWKQLIWLKLFGYIDRFNTRSQYEVKLKVNEFYQRIINDFAEYDSETFTHTNLLEWAERKCSVFPYPYLDKYSDVDAVIDNIPKAIENLYYSINQAKILHAPPPAV